MAKTPRAVETIEVEVRTGHLAVAALDEAIAEMAHKLASLPVHHRGHAARIVEEIERLAAVRNTIQGADHG